MVFWKTKFQCKKPKWIFLKIHFGFALKFGFSKNHFESKKPILSWHFLVCMQPDSFNKMAKLLFEFFIGQFEFSCRRILGALRVPPWPNWQVRLSTGFEGVGSNLTPGTHFSPSPWDIKWRRVVSSVLCWGNWKTLGIPELIGYVPDSQSSHLIIIRRSPASI